MATDPANPFDYYERIRSRQARGPAATDDPVMATVASIRAQDAKRAIMDAPDSPDEAARVTRIARAVGEPPAMIEGRAGDYEKAQNADLLSNVLNVMPMLGQYFSDNPRALVAAQDDHKSVGLLGRTLEFFKGIPGALEAGYERTGSGLSDLYQSIDEVILPFTNPSGGRAQLDRYERDGAAYRARAEAARPQSDSFVVQSALQGVESIPGSLAALVVGAATRNPTAAASVMGLQTGAPAYREALRAGKDTPTALRYGFEQGAIEALTERLPAGAWLDALTKRTPAGQAILRSLATELPGEQVATVLQDFSTWATMTPDRPFSEYLAERPEAALRTAIATVTGTAAQVGATQVTAKTGDALVSKVREVRRARAHSEVLTRFEKAAAESKLRQRDGEAYAEMVGTLAAQSGIESVMVPAEAVREYMQSDGYDRFSDPFEDYRDQVEEAFAVGGDVVLPADFALGTLPGTPAWSALRDDIRLTSGGMSPREAQSFDDAMADVVAEFETEMQAEYADLNAQLDAQGKLLQSVRDKLMNAGFTPYAAAQQAELIARRITTRAARMGQEVTGGEFTTEVRQVLPPELAKARAADATDLVINALRRGKDAVSQDGPSLLEWIAKRGGINDTGGDLASMGLDQWHRGKVGRRKLLRKFDAQASMGAISGQGDYGVDSTLRAAIDEGFFPELNNVQNEAGVDTLDTQILLDAMSAELAGAKRYAADARIDGYRAAAAELDQMLAERGLDPAGMTDAELRAVIAQMDEAGSGGFEQLPDMLEIDGVMRPTRNSEGQPLAGSEAGVRAFWNWFGESKVVDAEGRPLVVYHGTWSKIDAFNTEGGRGKTFGTGAFFSSSPDVSSTYASGGSPNVMPVYLALQNPAAFDAKGKNWNAIAKSAGVRLPASIVPDSEEGLVAELEGRGADPSATKSLKAKNTILGRLWPNEFGYGDETASTDDLARWARKQGYESAVIENVKDHGPTAKFSTDASREPATIYVAFSPTQIKSINNRGTFDPNDARILYQGGVEAYERRTPEEAGETTGLTLANSLAKAARLARDNRFQTGRDLKLALQQIALDAQKADGVDLTGFDDETANRLADYVVEDALEAVQDNQNAIGWYDRAVTAAKQELAKLYPEIATDPQAEFAFIWALAVTSNGLKVDKNFELAAKAYDAWKQDGAFPTNIGIGQAAKGINDGLALYAKLIENLGSWEAAREFMISEHPVRDIEKMSGIPISGEGKGEMVRGAAILGPKIGNGFFSNLYGYFDSLTMDRWLMRTVGRWRGTLIDINEKMVSQKREEIKAHLASLSPADLKYLAGFYNGSDIKFTGKLSVATIDAIANETAKRSMDPGWRERINKAAGGEDMRKLGNALAKYMDGQVEQPGGTKERAFIRKVFQQGLDRLREKDGLESLTMADLQALLWYPEKLLYESAKKPAGEEVRGYEDDEAPDYANAARKLVRDRLGQAVRDGDGRRADRAGSGSQQGAEAADAQVGVTEYYQSAYHGSPHLFDKFSLDAIGTGEGAQAYGWGLYFAGRREIAEHYRNTLTLDVGFDYAGKTGLNRAEVQNLVNMKYGGRYLDNVARASGVADKVMDDLIYGGKNNYKEGSERRAVYDEIAAELKRPENTGRLYEVEIPDDDEYLLWDKPLSEQPEKVKAALETLGITNEQSGETIYRQLQYGIAPNGFDENGRALFDGLKALDGPGKKFASEALHNAGIAGIKYLDGGSRADGDGSFNYVVFDDNRVSITAYEQSAEAVAEARALFDKLMDELGDGKDASAAFEQMKVLSNTREEWAKALGQEPGAIELKNRSGMRAAITKSQENPTGWRVTWFDDRGFSGHVETKTKEEAAKLAIFEGYDIPAPGALREAMASGTFFQRTLSDGPRGRIRFEQVPVIELFQGRNLSTLLHELGHQYLEELRFDAESPDAPAQLVNDMETVKAWFAANGHPIVDGFIPVEAHEMWARGFERYLMEGKAPSSALARVFETLRGWMLSIYKKVEALRSPITPEIREVFDRLLATDEEIQAAREQQALMPLFKDAAAVGMTGPEFEAYQAQFDEARVAANGEVLAKTMATIRRRVTAEYREQRAKVEEEVTARVDGQPLFKALRNLKAEPINADWLRDNMGEDVFSLLPKRVPPIWKDRGAHPDSVAEMSGYATGRQMVEALIGAELAHRQAKEGGDQRPLRVRAIQTETDAEMNAMVGDPLGDGTIEREALAAVNSEKQGEVMASELRAISRRTGQRPTPYKIARQWARTKVRQGAYNVEASPAAIQRHTRAVAKAGGEAERALMAGKFEDAFAAKQRQMLSSALLAEAKAAGDEVDAARKRLDKIARRVTSKSVDQDYLDQAHALLEAVDLRQRSQKSLDRKERFADWAAARAAEGFDVVVPVSFGETLGQTNWSRLPVETLLALDDAVAQVMHLGRLKQTLLDNQERREFDAVVSEAVETAGRNGDNIPPSDLMEPSFWDRAKSRVAALDAALLKMETVFDWLDGGDPNGIFNRVVFRPIAEAQHNEQAKIAEIVGKLNEAANKIPAAQLKRWGDRFSSPVLLNRETGNPFVFTREQLISVALNFGNRGNIDKLLGGYGWNEGAVKAVLDENLTAEEWAYVQEVWDTIDGLWPEIEAMEKRLNGVAPERVEAVPVETPYGTMRGGYFPVVYDPARNYDAAANAAKNSDLFENIYTRATTTRGFTKARTEVQRPIHLSLGIINRHVAEVVHDLTHREAIMQADKFLSDKRVRRAVDEALGPEISKAFRPWLQRIANEWAYDRAGLGGFENFLRAARLNATIVGMGFRFSTVLMQGAGFSNSFEVVGERWVGPAIARAAANPIEAYNFVIERSGEVRARMDTLDRDIRDNMKRQAGGVRLDAVKRFAFHGIGYMDRVVVVPTWIGAYDKAIAAGMTEDQAIYAADKAVRQSQGSGAAKDLAAVQAGRGVAGEALKLLTMFYSYMSAFYQRQRTLGRDIGRGSVRDLPRHLARAWWLVIVPPVLSELLAMRGPDEDDDEEWGAWAFKKIALAQFGAIPVARDVMPILYAKWADEKTFGYRATPATGAIESLSRLSDELERAAEGEETKQLTRTSIETVGYFTGLTTGQIAATSQFLVDVGAGDADPQGLSDWMEGITTGRIKED